MDGRSTISQIHNKAIGLTELESSLENLAIQGFIRTNSRAWDRRVEGDRTHEYDGVERRRDGADTRFTPIRARLINTAILTFGPNAENVVGHFRDAPGDWRGLEAAISECAQLARRAFGRDTAKQFEGKCWQILSKAVRTSPQRL
ncbi:MAG: hypothetical protein ACE5K1_04060 [Acidiferrobacterales bacterium]